jgi:hypothetical protein
MFIRGIKRYLKNPNKDDMRRKVLDLLESWFRRSLGDLPKDNNIAEIRSCLESYWTPLYRKIKSMSKSVMS